MNTDGQGMPSGTYVVPPYSSLPPPPSQTDGNNNHMTLHNVMNNQVVKLLAGIALAVSMAYVSMTVSRIDDRLEVSDRTDEKHNERILVIEKWQVEQKFMTSDLMKGVKELIDRLTTAVNSITSSGNRIADALEDIADEGGYSRRRNRAPPAAAAGNK